MTLLEAHALTKVFSSHRALGLIPAATTAAVRDVSFKLFEGEALGLVGESGSGKSTTGRLVMGLMPPTKGSVEFCGRPISRLSRAGRRDFRRQTQIVFQDPLASLNPRIKVEDTVAEPLEINNVGSKEERRGRVLELLGEVGLSSEHAERYPHQLSGGERQRVGIARALALRPKLVVLDEPVTALDVSIRAQILNLLAELRRRHRLSYLYISHDLATVRQICDRVAVMKDGRVVELTDTDYLFTAPQHDYTKRLLAAIPVPDPRRARRRAARS